MNFEISFILPAKITKENVPLCLAKTSCDGSGLSKILFDLKALSIICEFMNVVSQFQGWCLSTANPMIEYFSKFPVRKDLLVALLSQDWKCHVKQFVSSNPQLKILFFLGLPPLTFWRELSRKCENEMSHLLEQT